MECLLNVGSAMMYKPKGKCKDQKNSETYGLVRTLSSQFNIICECLRRLQL